jgi:hypothetical protein
MAILCLLSSDPLNIHLAVMASTFATLASISFSLGQMVLHDDVLGTFKSSVIESVFSYIQDKILIFSATSAAAAMKTSARIAAVGLFMYDILLCTELAYIAMGESIDG